MPSSIFNDGQLKTLDEELVETVKLEGLPKPQKPFFVYGDVHNHVESAQRFLNHEKPHQVIWLGDFTDSMNDSPLDLKRTGLWLKEMLLSRPQDIVIQSNHDLAYRFPETDKYKICGWTQAKHDAFYQHFPRELWSRFVIAHERVWNGQTLLFSHAGMDERFFPFGKYDFAHLERISKIAIANGAKEDYNPLFDHWSLGPMWLRWQNLKLLDGVCQVVGHTTHAKPVIRGRPEQKEWNLCLDCAHTYYAVFKATQAFAIDRHRGSEHRLNFHG